MTRSWLTRQALESYRALGRVINDLTYEEITACLDLEAASQRRRSVLERLTKRAIVLMSLSLQEKYLGKNSIQNHDHRRKENGDNQLEDSVERSRRGS